MEKNPKLAALFSGFLSDEDEDSENEGVDMEDISFSKEEDEPLFVESAGSKGVQEDPSLLNNMGAYMEDEDDEAAINQVITKMYKEEFETIADDQVVKEQDADIHSLSYHDFLKLWESQMPDAFLYLHSFNDEHKRILEKAMDEKDLSVLQTELNSIRKQFGKTNEGDELALESLQFHESFLESVISWKCENIINEPSPGFLNPFNEVNNDPRTSAHAQVSLVSSSPVVIQDDEDSEQIHIVSKPYENTGENIVLSDDEDEDIAFLPINSSSAVKSPSTTEKEDNTKPPVKIDISQSRLNTTTKSNVEHISLDEDRKDKTETKLSENGDTVDKNMTEELASVKDDKSEKMNESIISTDELVVAETAPSIEPTETDKVNRGYNSEDELEGNAQGEEDEYARFVSDIASKHLEEIRQDLHRDMKELNNQQRKDMGNSDDVTDQMVQDIQELLKLFGVPFIVSPMEAEAQCAELESLHLIDGTITDDSDVFLFGASRVYKNMFNQQRFVECYMSKDIEREMLLSRKKLIQLAFLLGSDYTDGIPGVGPVAAMEILSEFSAPKEQEGDEEENEDEEYETVEGPLIRFKEWYNGGVDTTPFQRKFVSWEPSYIECVMN